MRRDVRKGCHIYSMLKKSSRRPHISFHTPGHKKGKWDLTELSYTDNLLNPVGCIERAQKDIARILGGYRSFILTDGSTCGVLAMLYAAKDRGAKIIAFPEDAHVSVFNGCSLLGLTPLLLPVRREKNVPLPPSFEGDFTREIEGADAILLTLPTYYGKRIDLTRLRAYCEENQKLLLIDGAHGGHLHFQDNYEGKYADLWVAGVHKSLPALTQGAVLSARTEALADAVEKGLLIFRTTSPSYPIMASVEYAVKYPRNLPLEKEVAAFVESCPRAVKNEDWTKLCIRFGNSAGKAYRDLEKRGIYGEFFDSEVILFYLSPATKLRSFRRLKRELSLLFKRYPYEKEICVERNHTPLLSLENKSFERVNLEEAEGRICAQNCGLFPPCSPVILAGEKITKEGIAALSVSGGKFGLIDNKILVVKE